MPHPVPSADLPPIQRLREIMHLLRGPGGCPWDAEQTHESLARHLIEEAYEVAEAIRSGSTSDLVEELGDVLLQPVFHAEIASERGDFDLDDVASSIGEKLIRRHPHVFGEAWVDGADGVLTQWEAIKKEEKAGGGGSPDAAVADYLLSKANEGMPALMACQGLQRKVAKVGFDWDSLEPVFDKVREELAEVEHAVAHESGESVGEEIGDLLFVVVNLARKAGFEAELLLHQTNGKFVRRFRGVEDVLRGSGLSLESAGLAEMDAAWDQVKVLERKKAGALAD